MRPIVQLTLPFVFNRIPSNLLCEVDGCDRRFHDWGLCLQHFKRWHSHCNTFKTRFKSLRLQPSMSRDKTPQLEVIQSRKQIKSKQALFIEQSLQIDTDHCHDWPFAKVGKGYAIIVINGNNVSVARLVCERVYGPPLTPKAESAHSCKNPSCINKLHLRWATHKDNMNDKTIHTVFGTDFTTERLLMTKKYLYEPSGIDLFSL